MTKNVKTNLFSTHKWWILTKYVLIAGAGNVGAFCLTIHASDRNIFIDCGMHANQHGFDALPYIDLLYG